jgi:hypothetical protein
MLLVFAGIVAIGGLTFAVIRFRRARRGAQQLEELKKAA